MTKEQDFALRLATLFVEAREARINILDEQFVFKMEEVWQALDSLTPASNPVFSLEQVNAFLRERRETQLESDAMSYQEGESTDESEE